MKIHQLGIDEALHSMGSSANGLTSAEADRRCGEFGPNRVEARLQQALWQRFAKEFVHFFALILWAAAALAFFAEWRQPGEGMATLGAAILGVILINGSFSFWQEYKAERALAALKKLLPQQVRALRDGEPVELDAEQLVPGDVIFLGEGDRVPADCRLIQSFGLIVDNATLTGESQPQPRECGPQPMEAMRDAHNIVFAGTAVAAGEGRAVVFATGAHSEFGQIAHLTQYTRESPSPLLIEIGRLSRIVISIAFSLGLLFFVGAQWTGLPLWSCIIFAIGIIVALVPEGLLPTVTLSLAMAAQRMAKRSALVRHLTAVETLGCTTVICTDKTGTLTQNKMALRALVVGSTRLSLEDWAALADAQGQRRLRETLGLCHNLKRGPRGWLGDPMEIALAESAWLGTSAPAEAPRLAELPFDSRRKRMSVLHQLPEGCQLYTKGAVETVLPLCNGHWDGNQRQPLDATSRKHYLQQADALADQGLRVLALAWREVEDDRLIHEDNLTLLGLVGLEDPPRPEVADAIAKCHQAGIRVLMVTGDGPRTAAAIGREIGLVRGEQLRVITGDQLQRLSKTQLQLALDTRELLFARVSPEQKMRIVDALQHKRQVVAVTGDGVNDAPALKQADIGVAMGKSGTDVAREAADIVLLDDNFATIVAAIEEGRGIYDNIRKFLTYILASNIAELVPFLCFVLLRIPLPLTIIQILAVDLGTDMLPALALGAERPAPEVMSRPPRQRSERLLNGPLLARGYGFLGMMVAASAMALFFFVLFGLGWQHGMMYPASDPGYRAATTACLVGIVMAQVANVFACRSPLRSAFDRTALSNPLLWWGIGFELLLILAIVYTPWGQQLFGTAPLGGEVWALGATLALGLLAAEELRKWLMRHRRARTAT